MASWLHENRAREALAKHGYKKEHNAVFAGHVYKHAAGHEVRYSTNTHPASSSFAEAHKTGFVATHLQAAKGSRDQKVTTHYTGHSLAEHLNKIHS